MKQTNNAIKFLMAQYRAIFQNAYFKGLATAAVVTAGLAAGQAQAANPSVYGDTQTSTEATVTIDGTSTEAKDNLKAYAKLTVTNKSKTFKDQTIVITGGAIANNEVKAETANAKLTVKNLEIKAGAATNGLKVHSAGAFRSDLNVLDTTTITSGTLQLAGNAADAEKRAYLDTKKISINGAKAADAVLDLGGFTTAGHGVAVDASGTTTKQATLISLDGKGTIKFGGTAAADAVLNGQFVGDGEAVLDFSTQSKMGTISAYGTINKASLTIASGSNAAISLADKDQTAVNEGSLTINEGAITFADTDSKLLINNGELVLGDKVTLSASKDSTSSVNVGTATTEGTLVLKKENLDAFLSAKTKGGVAVSKSGSLIFSDENVDLSGYNVVKTAVAGSVSVGNDPGALLGGNNVTVGNALSGDGAVNVTIQALDTLTLGNTSDASAAFGVAGFEAKNLNLVMGGDDTAFKVANDIVLVSDKEVGRTAKNKVIEAADNGSITGSDINVNGGSLTVAAGNYTTSGQNITLTSGTLDVTSDFETLTANDEADTIASSLTIKGGEFKVIGSGTNAVTVSGAKASLDLSQTNLLSVKGNTAANVGIVTQDGATLTIGQAQFESFAKKIGDNSGDKNAYFGIDGGTLKADSLTLNQGQLVSGANFDSPVAGINFKNTSSGTLEVAQTLTIKKADTAVAIGENGFIQAGTLVLAPNTDNAATKLGTGNFTVLNALQTESEGGIETTDTTSKVTFGKLEFVNGKNATDGYKAVVGSDALISGKLKVTNGAHNIAAGNWTAEQDLTIAAGTFNIGNVDNKDADGNIIKTSLTVEGKLDAAAGVTVAKESTLKANELNASAQNAITVDGTANVAGKAGTESGTGLYGVALGASGALKVNGGGELNFTGKALEGFYFDESTNALLNEKVTDGSIVTVEGAQVNLNYTSGTTITVDQLANLNKVFDNGTINGIVNLGDATLDGLKPDTNKEITWDAAKKYENYLPGYTNNGLKEATLTGVTSGTKVSGHFGSIKTDDTFASGSLVDVQKKGGLYNAKPLAGDESGKKYFAVNSSGGSLGLNIADKTTEFTLGGEGIIDHVKFANSGTLAIDKGFGDVAGNVTVSKTISGGATSVLNIKNGKLTVAGEKKNGVEIGVLKSEAGTSLKTPVLAITSTNTVSNVNGNVYVEAASGASTSIGAGGAIFGGKENKFAGSFAATGDVEFTNGGTSTIDLTKDVADFAKDLGISGDAKVVVNGVLSMTKAPGATLNDQASINVGEYDPANADKVNSSGFLQAQYISLGGNALAIDPAYGKNTSVVEVGAFTDTATSAKPSNVSKVNGDIYVLQNSALLVGMNAKGELDVDSGRAFLASVQDNGSLTDPEKGGKIGSLLYVNSQQKLAAGSSIVVDALANEGNVVDANDVLNTKYTDAKSFGTTTDTADLYLGKGSVIALGAGAHKDNGSIVFDFKDAAVFAEQGGKIILDSDSYLKGDRNVVVFQDADNNGVNILGTPGTNDIRVETINGLMYFTLTAGKESAGGILTLDTAKADTAFSQASAPMKDFLVGYTALTKNWSEYYAGGSNVERVELVGEQGPAAEKFNIDPNGNITSFVDPTEFDSEDKASNYVAIQTGTKPGTTDPSYTIYHKANNLFLEKIVQNTQGAAADQAARMGDFGGAAETALVATSTTYDSVAGRFGMGQQAGTMTIANNGQGSGLWVTPVYKSHESDGFDADGLGYGSDITLYGVALGGDVTLANGVRVGAMFNVGSGDADGQGAASVVSNDFDYFGGSIYAGYAIDNLSIVGDISYTTIDSDVEANTAAGKTSTSFDTTALSVGVTGQYALKVAEMDVTPHAGMRFTRIDMDDYTIESADFGKVGQYNASSANVFSIPVGVTISKEYVTDTWTVKPSFDLTLTGNFGDDTVDGTVSWTGVSNWDVSTKAEFVDNFTYGAAVGIAAKTGNFGLGLGLNYTGSSNTDEFGVNANARYMF